MTDMSDLNENLGRIAESNERSAELYAKSDPVLV